MDTTAEPTRSTSGQGDVPASVEDEVESADAMSSDAGRLGHATPDRDSTPSEGEFDAATPSNTGDATESPEAAGKVQTAQPETPVEIDDLHELVRRRATEFPGAKEDHPWGEVAVKVNDRVFLFLGPPHEDAPAFSFSVRLPRSGPDLLVRGLARRTGYGLGGAGWVTLTIHQSQMPPVRDIIDWVTESFEAVRA